MENKENNIDKTIEKEKTVRDTLYGRIEISLEKMDKLIIVLFALLVFSLIVGILV